MGGLDSKLYKDFITLMFEGIWALKRHSESLIDIIEIMSNGNFK